MYLYNDDWSVDIGADCRLENVQSITGTPDDIDILSIIDVYFVHVNLASPKYNNSSSFP